LVEITINLGDFGVFYLAIHHQDHYFLANLITGYPEFDDLKYG
jgi:hypothetical protein